MSKLDDLKQKLNKNKPKRMKFAGLSVIIENPVDSIRKGVNSKGKSWATRLSHPYGYLEKGVGADGEQLDCFLGNHPEAKDVYIVHQNSLDGKYDEDKCLLAFPSAEEAKKAYLSNYDTSDYFRSMTTIPMNSFKKMLTTEKPGSIKWTRKQRRNHKSEAMFSTNTENFDADTKEKWLTIGGHSGPEGKHEGGSHIEISGDGDIEKGPPDLKNKPISDLKSKMSSKITPGVPQINSPKPSSAPAPKIIPNSQYDLKTGKQINSQPTPQKVEAKPIQPPVEHPFFDKKINDVAKTDQDNDKWWTKPNQVSDPNKLNPVQQGQKNIANDKESQSAMKNSHDLKNFGWGKMAQAGNANADKINNLAAQKGITANQAQSQLSQNISPQLAQQNLPNKNASGIPGSSPINQSQDNPTPSSVNPPQEQLQPNVGAPKGPINDKPTNKSPESSLFYPPGKFFPPSESKAPVNAPQVPPQELLSDKPMSGVQRITPDDFAKGWDGIEGWVGARDNPEHAENIAKGLNQLGDREHAVMQHSNGKHIVVSRPKQGQANQGLGQNQLSQTPPEQIQPNTQIPNEEMQEQLGSTGAATPAINNPNEIKQQENKPASQEPLFDNPKTPSQEPLPEEPEQKLGGVQDYSKASIERQLLDHYQKNGGNADDQDEKLTSAYHSPFTFRRTSKTKSGFPGEIDRMLEGPNGKKLRRLLSLTDNPESSQGADLMGDLGVDGYEQLLNRKLGGKKNTTLNSALDFAKKSGDPQMEFLAKLHSITPDRQDKKPQEVINTQALQTGEAATIHGIPVTINEDENGNKSIDDGGHLPSVPLESMKQLPIDKGSLHNTEEPEVDESPFAPDELNPEELNEKTDEESQPEPSQENAPVESSQDNSGQENGIDSGIGEENPEINKDEQGNRPDTNVNPTTESPEINPSNQIGKSEGENRDSESKPQSIPPIKSNKLEEKPNEKIPEKEKSKAVPQHSETTNESHKDLGKEKQNVGSSDSKEKVNESPKDKPAPQSPVTSNPPAKNEVKEENPKASAQIHPPYKHPLRDIYEKANPRSQQASKEANKSGNKVNIQESGIQARGSAMGLHGAKKREDAINNAIKQYGPTEKAMQVAVANSYRQPLSKSEKQYFKDYAESLAKSKNPSTSVETPPNNETAKSPTTSEIPEVDNTKQLGLYEKDKSGNPKEVGEKPGQSNLFNPNKFKTEEKPKEEKVAPQFDPKHTQEMFPNKEQSKPIDQLKEKMNPDKNPVKMSGSPIDQLKDKMQKNKGSGYDINEDDGYIEIKRNGQTIATGTRQPNGKIGDLQYKHPVHQKLDAIRNAVQRAINEHEKNPPSLK